MADITEKRNLLLDLRQNIKDGIEGLSIEELDLAIHTLELAKDNQRERERRELQKKALLAQSQQSAPVEGGVVLVIPKGMKAVEANAYKGDTRIVRLLIEDGVTQIGEYAFEGCTNLREVMFPRTRIMLRKGCFKNCTSLKHVAIPDIANISPGTFENCTSLETVYLPSTISNIYSRAFKNCRALHTVTTLKSKCYYKTVRVFSHVFENCISLRNLEIHNGYFDKKSFVNCPSLEKRDKHYRFCGM